MFTIDHSSKTTCIHSKAGVRMELEKVQRQRNIEILIAHGRLDEAEDLLKNTIIPNTGRLQARIDALRAEQQASTLPSPHRQRLKTFGIALAIILVVTGVVVFMIHSSVGEGAWFFVLIGFVFIIPGVYRSASRETRLERRARLRTGYRRPGYGPPR